MNIQVCLWLNNTETAAVLWAPGLADPIRAFALRAARWRPSVLASALKAAAHAIADSSSAVKRILQVAQ